MQRILDIASKDLLQLKRDRKTFLFLLIMPIAFTFLFGLAFGGFNKGGSDHRLPVGYLDEDRSWFSRNLHDQLARSDVIALVESDTYTEANLALQVGNEKLAGAIIVPPGYHRMVLHDKIEKLILIADTSGATGKTVESEALTAAIHLDSALRTAIISLDVAGDKMPFNYTYQQALKGWQDPPIKVVETTSSAIKNQSESIQSLSHTSPGMMMQFSIAGLLTAASILVNERKTRSLQRLLTTATQRSDILLGHYLAILTMIFCQFLLLIAFGQIVLHVDYMSDPGATLLVSLCTALCIAALGLLIGVFAKKQEQAIMYSLILMFTFSGLGGAWVPLEVTGVTFQAIGHITPVAWALDGYNNILLRGLGLKGVLLPCAMLLVYGIVLFSISTWRFNTAEER